MNTLRFGWNWLANEPHQQRGVRILQVAIGFMLLFEVFTEARFGTYLWGPQGVGSGSAVSYFGGRLGRLFDHIFDTALGTHAVVMLLGLGALGLVLGCKTRFSSACALLAFILLEGRLEDLPDGGDNIARLVLCYMLFLLPAGVRHTRGGLAVWLHNIAVLAIALQVSVLYSTAGLAKANGDLWHHGTAMYYISQVQWFSLPVMRDMFKNPFITTMSSYVPVLFQLWFPVAVLSPLRRLWIGIGVLFHIGIAVFMGLVTFSAVMIALDLMFVSDQEYAWVGGALYRLKGSVTWWIGAVARPNFPPSES